MKNTKVDEQVKEVVDTSAGTTKVKVRFTELKFFNSNSEKLETISVIGKLTMPEAKKHLKELNDENILISKSNSYEEFEVDTIALYQLKQSV